MGSGEKLPLIILPDGEILSDPRNREVADATSAAPEPERDDFDMVIVGAGPAGLSAAVYGASERLNTLVVDEGGIGGQATLCSLRRTDSGMTDIMADRVPARAPIGVPSAAASARAAS